MRAIAGLAAALMLCGVAAAAEPDGHKQEVFAWWRGYEVAPFVKTPDGRQIRVFCQGKGAPVAVLESGAGAGAWGWRNVQPEMARITRTCSYDRAGFGPSSEAKDSRDINAVSDDLAVVVRAVAGAKAVVLVGHSMGGPIVRQFAYRHPKAVAGLVLVDPSGDHQMERFAALNPGFSKLQETSNAALLHCAALLEKGPITLSMPEYRLCIAPKPEDMPLELGHFHEAYNQSPVHLRASVAEMNAMSPESGREADAARRPLGDTPLIVLTAGKMTRPPGFSDEDDRRITALWRTMHWEMLGLSTRSKRRFVDGAGHSIQVDQPQAVIDAFREVVDAARGR